MKRNRNSLKSIRRDFMLTQTVLIIVLTLVLGAAGAVICLRAEAGSRDRNLQNVAETVAAAMELSDEPLEEPAEGRTRRLDALYNTLDNIDVISVINSSGVRIYHSNHDLIGTVYDGNLPDFSLYNGKSYAEDGRGPSGTQRRAYAPVRNPSGEEAGFVISLALMTNIQGQIRHIIVIFLIVALAALLVELLISFKLSDGIKKRLNGYEPDAFTALYKIRDDILESIDEGIVAVDRDAKVQFINQSAEKMLSDSGGGEDGGNQAEELSRTFLLETLQSGEKESGVPVRTAGGTDVLADRQPIRDGETVIGAIGILHDRTEYTRLMEDLSGTRYLVDSMRANNHDFTNKLHVILGLLEMEMYEEAMAYIENITMVQKETISRIMNAIHDPTVAALLIGKQARAAELNVFMRITEESSYSKYDIMIPGETLVTIIGNLIDNAFDAMNSAGLQQKKELIFGMYSLPGKLLITVEDNGPGIAPSDLPRIYDLGFSTKGEGRGTGLHHIKGIIENLGGEIEVSSEVGKGTVFAVRFDRTGGKGDGNHGEV